MNFQKFELKWKVIKHFARLKQRATLRKLSSLHPSASHQIKPYYVSKTKNFLRRYLAIYRHLLSKCFKNAVLERQEMVQCNFFWHQTKTWLLENLWSKKYFWLCCRSNVKWVEVPKVSDTFWAKLYCKICDLFCQFLLALRLSARKSEIEKETQIKSTGMSEKI